MNLTKHTVIILEDSSKTHFGGGQKITLEVAKTLSNSHRLILADTVQDTLFKQRIKSLISDFIPMKTYGKIRGYSSAGRALFVLDLIVSVFLLPFNTVRLAKYIKTQKSQGSKILIYATTKQTLVIANIINVLTKTPFIYHGHNAEEKNFLAKLIVPPLSARANYAIAVSQTASKHLKGNVLVVYNPTDKISGAPKNLPRNSEEVVTVSLSALIDFKGIEYFATACKYVTRKIKCEIYGTGPLKNKLKKISKHIPNLKLKGFTDNPNKVWTKAHIAVVPTIDNEACPMTVIEALSFGIPVITTNIGGQAEIIKDGYNGFTVPIKDPKAIAEKIDTLVSNPNLYAQMSKNALSSAKQFDKSVFESKIQNIFKRV